MTTTNPNTTTEGGWLSIDTAPEDGSRVRVGHNLDPSSMKAETIFKTTGAFNVERGVWECSAAFVCIDGFLRWQPTHWFNAPVSA